MIISDQQYLYWQKKIKESPAFRQFWTFWGIYSVLLIFIIGGYLLLIGEWKKVVVVFASFILARYIVSPLIFYFYKKPRPYQRLHFKTIYSWLMSKEKTIYNSFPSDHAIGFAAVAAVLIYYYPFLGSIILICALINGPARIILGYHDEKDVLAGWTLGILVGITTLYALGMFW